MKQYEIVTETGFSTEAALERIVQRVNEEVQVNGWVPLGGVVYLGVTGYIGETPIHGFCQALVKYALGKRLVDIFAPEHVRRAVEKGLGDESL